MDHYQTLGIDPSADADAIKKAYRTRAKATHPDANPTDPTAAERFKALGEAYAVLSDPGKRRVYDLTRGMRTGATESRRDARATSTRSSDLPEVTLSVSEQDLKDARGYLRFDIDTDACCILCEGEATIGGPQCCRECRGEGTTERWDHKAGRSVATREPCTPCGGTGQLPPRHCPACRGRGSQRIVQTITLKTGWLLSGEHDFTFTPRGSTQLMRLRLSVRPSPRQAQTSQRGRTWFA